MKTPTQKERVKAWLNREGSITTGDALHRMKPEIRRLAARIGELQEDGIEIEKDWLRVNGVKTKEYVYTLVGGRKLPPKMVMVEVDGRRVMRMIPGV